MDRKKFLKEAFRTGVCGCAAALGIGNKLGAPGEDALSAGQAQAAAVQGLSHDLRRRMREGSRSPDWARIEKAESWVKFLIDNMDALLDEETRIKLLNACGRSCYFNAFGVAGEKKPSPEAAERYLQALEKGGFRVERGTEATTVYYGWARKQNPQGLSLAEGYCMCPLVENEILGLSPSYCNCSAGYVAEGLERATGRKVLSVEILESVKRGGQDCRFKVVLSNA
jgi:hypothetical protein